MTTTGTLLPAGAAVLAGAVVQGTIGQHDRPRSRPARRPGARPGRSAPLPAALALVVRVLDLLAVLRERAQTD